MSFKHRYLDILFLVIGIFITLAYFFFLYKPLNIKLKRLWAEETLLKDNPIPIEAIQQTIAQLDNEKGYLDREIHTLEGDFSRVDFWWDMMQRVSLLAKELGLKINLIQPQVTTEGREYQQCSLSIKVNGDFPGLCRFLYQLEKTGPGLKGKSLKMEAILTGENKQYLTQELQFDLLRPRIDGKDPKVTDN